MLEKELSMSSTSLVGTTTCVGKVKSSKVDRDSVISSLSVPSIHELCAAANRRSASLSGSTTTAMNNDDDVIDNNNNNNNNNNNSDSDNNKSSNNQRKSSKFILPSVLKRRGARSRVAVSADNSPVLTRKMKAASDGGGCGVGGGEPRRGSCVRTKLHIPNMEKYDVVISCLTSEHHHGSWNDTHTGAANGVEEEEVFHAQIFKVKFGKHILRFDRLIHILKYMIVTHTTAVNGV